MKFPRLTANFANLADLLVRLSGLNNPLMFAGSKEYQGVVLKSVANANFRKGSAPSVDPSQNLECYSILVSLREVFSTALVERVLGGSDIGPPFRPKQ